MQILRSLYFLLLALSVLLIPGCGGGSSGSHNQLQSITINPQNLTAQGGQGQFTATGVFSDSPMTSVPVAVAWFTVPPVRDPAGTTVTLSRTSQPFTASCFGSGPVSVFALAPMDANASANVSIPIGTFLDLVLRGTATLEDGFVAGTAQMTCP